MPETAKRIVDGFGFIVYVSDEYLREFILKHESTIAAFHRGEELIAYTKSHTGKDFNPKENFYDWENGTTEDNGIYGMIADVMTKETGISWAYYYDTEGNSEDEVIVFQPHYPWEYNSVEKNITMEQLEDICKKYIHELGGQLVPKFLHMEYTAPPEVWELKIDWLTSEDSETSTKLYSSFGKAKDAFDKAVDNELDGFWKCAFDTNGTLKRGYRMTKCEDYFGICDDDNFPSSTTIEIKKHEIL